MIEVTSNPAWAYSTLANLYLNMDLTYDAIKKYQTALQYKPEDDGLWVALADAYEKSGLFEEADDAYARALEAAIKPSNMVYDQFLYGNFLYRQGRYDEAIFQWESALVLDPQQCDLMLNLGSAYKELDQVEKARNIYTKALSLAGTADPECITKAQMQLAGLSP